MTKRWLANMVSGMFHPLLIITYAVIITLTFTYMVVYPISIKLHTIGITILTTTIFPGAFIYLLVKCGAATGMDLTDRRERTIPYLVYAASIMACTFFLHRMMFPFWFILQLWGGCLALLFVTVINFFWKVSAHATAIGGLLGGVMGISQIQMMNPYIGFILLTLIAGIVCTSRIYLNKHTPLQVYVGFCLGFICTFAAALVSLFFFIL